MKWTDDAGNICQVKDGIVFLKMKNEGGRVREIGKYYKNKNDKIVFKKAENDIYRIFNAFGFNAEVIDCIKPDIIRVRWYGIPEEAKVGLYAIAIEDFKEKVKYHNHKKVGFELRCYVPVHCFKFKVL